MGWISRIRTLAKLSYHHWSSVGNRTEFYPLHSSDRVIKSGCGPFSDDACTLSHNVNPIYFFYSRVALPLSVEEVSKTMHQRLLFLDPVVEKAAYITSSSCYK